MPDSDVITFRPIDDDIIERLWQIYLENQTLEMSREGIARLKHAFFSSMFALVQMIPALNGTEDVLILLRSIAEEAARFMNDPRSYKQ